MTATNSGQAIPAVRGGTADLGFIEPPFLPKGLRSKVVGHDELVLIVPAGHKWAQRRRSITAAELSQTPLVTREPGSGTRDSLTAALRRALGDSSRQAHPVLELSSAAAVRAAVAAGAGPAGMSRLAVADDLAIGRLRRGGRPPTTRGRRTGLALAHHQPGRRLTTSPAATPSPMLRSL